MRTGSEVLRFARVVPLAAAVLVCLSPSANALPSCPAATPVSISTPGMKVDQTWQRYRGLPSQHRCCAKVCEPLATFAAKVEYNALALNTLARDPTISQPTRQQALRDANAMFALRFDLAVDFTDCQTATRPRAGATLIAAEQAPVQACGAVDDPVALAWAKWCDAYSVTTQKVQDLLAKSIGTAVGEWKVESDYFRIRADGGIDPTTVSIKPSPATKLPAGKTTKPFADLLKAMRFSPLPVNGGQTEMWMRVRNSAVRQPGGGDQDGNPINSSWLIRPPCPGPSTRPAS